MRAILTGFISLILIGPSVSADYTVGSLPRYDDLVETTPLYAGSPWSRPYIGLASARQTGTTSCAYLALPTRAFR
jgi:hypothetical protein